MTMKPANTGKRQDTKWKKGESGNPTGRKLGTRNKATMLAETLLESETEVLVRKCIEMALAGDSTAIRIVMERLLPVRKDRPISLELKKLEKVEDASKALGTITKAVAQGEITPLEGQSMANIIETHRRAIETMDLERRLIELEEKAEQEKKFKHPRRKF
jgi:hypothetical protein